MTTTLYEYLNTYAELYTTHVARSKEFQDGYKQAMHDVMQKAVDSKVMVQGNLYNVILEEPK
jgi:hypothetical protein